MLGCPAGVDVQQPFQLLQIVVGDGDLPAGPLLPKLHRSFQNCQRLLRHLALFHVLPEGDPWLQKLNHYISAFGELFFRFWID